MKIDESVDNINRKALEKEISLLMQKLYPICRSITGNGFRETVRILQEYISLSVHEIPTGTKVFDWEVPKEWNIRDAYIKNSKGVKIVDFKENNLHVMSYSVPVRAKMSLEELQKNLFTLPDYPDWIPYKTSYYNETWGFCISYNQFKSLTDDIYDVCIDSTIENGCLTYGEYYCKGETSDEILISCHACHPSLCNDNVSGLSLVALLGKILQSVSLRYSYRIIIIPGTIGSITWLAKNQLSLARIKHGLVVNNVGDNGELTYKRSRIGDAEIDKVTEHVLRNSGLSFNIVDFSPYGYDERQYCSPGINLPVGSLQRTPHGQYPEYHTSADNLDFVLPENVFDSLLQYLNVCKILENNKRYINEKPYCEPQLGSRGLYDTSAAPSSVVVDKMALLWVLNLSDGTHSLLDISERSGIKFDLIKTASDALMQKELLSEYID